jgi:hypothetical protein
MSEPSSPPALGPSAGRTPIDVRLIWSLGLIVVAARLAVFAYAGSPLPYYDQWILEFNNIYINIQAGDSWLSILFTKHNEHWVATTRLLSLIGFGINGYWDVKFLVVVAALVRAGEAMLAFRMLGAGHSPAARWMVFAGCIIVFAAPVSGYNLLCGISVHFFLADLATLWAVHSVVRWDHPFAGALRLVTATALGVISFGSGFVIPSATLAAHLAIGKRRPGFWGGWIASALVSITAVIVVAGRGRTMGTSVAFFERIDFLLSLVSWPILNSGIGAGLVTVLLVWAIRLFRTDRQIDDGLGCSIGISAFAAANAAMLALGRAPEDLHMRHWDTLSLGTLALFSVFVALAGSARTWRLPAFAFAGIWGAACAIALASQIANHTWPYIREAHDGRDAALVYYRELFLTGRITKTTNQLYVDVPKFGHWFFDDPVGRYIPHPVAAHNMMLNPARTLSLLAPEIIPGGEKSVGSQITDKAITLAWIAGLLGLGLSLWAVAGRARSEALAGASEASRKAGGRADYRGVETRDVEP